MQRANRIRPPFVLLVAVLTGSLSFAGACSQKSSSSSGGSSPTPVSTTIASPQAAGPCQAISAETWDMAGMTVSGTSFAAGDEVLMLEAQDTVWNLTTNLIGHAGVFERLEVSSVAPTGASGTGQQLSFNPPATITLWLGTNSAAELCRVEKFGDVVIGSSGGIAAAPWNGTTGGVVAVHIFGSLILNGTEALTAAASGFRGGVPTVNSASGACTGNTSSAGEGLQAKTWNVISSNGVAMGGGAGGAEFSGGGGGGNAGAGGSGGQGFNGQSSCDFPGSGAGSILTGSRVFFGGGGGAGSASGTADGTLPPSGGAGGGLVYLVLEPGAAVSGNGTLDASGGSPTQGVSPGSAYTYGGAGGGAGGTVLIENLGGPQHVAWQIKAAGGNGQSLDFTSPSSGQGGAGGGGGGGRIVVVGTSIMASPASISGGAAGTGMGQVAPANTNADGTGGFAGWQP